MQYSFVGNLTDFPAGKEFRKSVKIWWNYRQNRVAHFFRHSVYIIHHTAAHMHIYTDIPCFTFAHVTVRLFRVYTVDTYIWHFDIYSETNQMTKFIFGPQFLFSPWWTFKLDFSKQN